MFDSSINSVFRFISYKVDHLRYEVAKNVGLLEFQRNIDPSLWEYEFGIRQPLYIEEKKYYLCGLDCKIFLFANKIEESMKTQENALVYIEASITGLFSISDEENKETAKTARFDKAVEDNLVKIQMPAILLPYLRGTITSLLANAGFGAIVFPLINVQELAKKALENSEIKVVR